MAPPRPTHAVLVAAGLGLWLLAVAAGGGWFYARGYEAGATGAPEQTWPAGGRVERDPARPTLVLALHPECPCSSATVGELARILADTRERLAVRVLVADYDDLGERAENSALWRQAAALPGVAMFADRNLAESRRFHARTSGETRLYDSAGKLVFHGGITLSRGHAGPNPGEQAVRDFVRGAPRSGPVSTPVFGCAL